MHRQPAAGGDANAARSSSPLAEPGWKVIVGWDHAEPTEDVVPPPPKGFFPRLNWVAVAFVQILRRVAWFAHQRPDVVSIHSADPIRSLACLLAARLALRKRCYLSWYASGVPFDSPRLVGFLARRLATGFVLISTDALDAARSFGVPPERLFLVRPGVTVPPRDPARRDTARRVHLLADDEFVALSVARLVPSKGVNDAIRALASLTTPKAVTLIVAGDGPEADSLKELAANLVPGHVRFVGWVAHDALQSLYAAADVFVLPSRREGFPMVYAEAAMYGVASIACDVFGVRDAVRDGETGLLVPPGDERALSAALQRLHDEPVLRASLGDAARARAESELTLERMITDYKTVLGPGTTRLQQAST